MSLGVQASQTGGGALAASLNTASHRVHASDISAMRQFSRTRVIVKTKRHLHVPESLNTLVYAKKHQGTELAPRTLRRAKLQPT